MSIVPLLGLLVGAQLGVAFAEVGCEWSADASTCSAAVHMTDDAPAQSLIADAGTCISNTAEGLKGCKEDLPGCQAVTIRGLNSFGVCIPALAVLGIVSATDAESLFEIQNCADISTPACDAVRESYYGLLGCPECVEEANAAAALAATCAAATTEAACATAGSAPEEPFPTFDPPTYDPVTYDASPPYEPSTFPTYYFPEYDADPPVEDSGWFYEPVEYATPPFGPYEYIYTYGPVEEYADTPDSAEYEPRDFGAFGPTDSAFGPGAAGYEPYTHDYAYTPFFAIQPTAVYDPFVPYYEPFAPLAAPPYGVDYGAAPPVVVYDDAFYGGDGYFGPYDASAGPAPAPFSVPPLDLDSIDVSTVTETPEVPEEEATVAEPPTEDSGGVSTSDVRDFLQPYVADGDADAPATVLLEPFAAAARGRLAAAAVPLASMIVAVACMLV